MHPNRIFLLSLFLWLVPASAAEKTGLLVQLGIEKDEKTGKAQIYDAVVNADDLKKGVGFFVAETDRRARARAVELGKSPNSIATLAGTWMEYSLMVALKQRNKTPLVWQAEFAGFKKNYFDIVLWTKEHGPVVLSPKTSLRERYKQGDLEAFALKKIFPNAKFYLLTLDADKRHVANVQKKIKNGDMQALDGLYDETNTDDLFQQLDALTIIAPDVKALLSGRTVK